MKKAFFILLILLIPLSQSRLLITTSDTQAEVSDLDTEFRVGLVNTGEDLNLTLETEGSVDIEMPERIFLEGSDPTSVPSGSGWYYAGEGHYYPVKYVDMKVEIPQGSEKRSHSFDLLLTRKYEARSDRPQVETVREIGFEVFTTSELIDTGFSTGPEKSQDENRTAASEEPTGDQILNSTQPVEEQNNDSSRERDSNSEFTVLLAAGVFLSVAWLLKEVLI